MLMTGKYIRTLSCSLPKAERRTFLVGCVLVWPKNPAVAASIHNGLSKVPVGGFKYLTNIRANLMTLSCGVTMKAAWKSVLRSIFRPSFSQYTPMTRFYKRTSRYPRWFSQVPLIEYSRPSSAIEGQHFLAIKSTTKQRQDSLKLNQIPLLFSTHVTKSD